MDGQNEDPWTRQITKTVKITPLNPGIVEERNGTNADEIVPTIGGSGEEATCGRN